MYGGTSYLTLFGTEKYDAVYNRIRYLISITYVFLTIMQKLKSINIILYL